MMHINFTEVLASFSLTTTEQMLSQWARLHAGDAEPVPDNPALADAWLRFHQGDFLAAAEQAAGLPDGLTLRLKALSTYAHYLEQDAEQKVERLLAVVSEAESALKAEQAEDCNLHYQIAYSLGRYGQFISIAKALQEGLAGRVERALQRCLALNPQHADAHTALATYQTEIIDKLGRIAARITYSASADDAEQHYLRAIELAPYSVSAKTEYADGMLTLHGRKRLRDATELYQAAVSHRPADALEGLDIWLAQKELAEA